MTLVFRLVSMLLALCAMPALGHALDRELSPTGYRLAMEITLDGELVADPVILTRETKGIVLVEPRDGMRLKLDYAIEEDEAAIARQFGIPAERAAGLVLLEATLYSGDPSQEDGWVAIASPALTLDRSGWPASLERAIGRDGLPATAFGLSASFNSLGPSASGP